MMVNERESWHFTCREPCQGQNLGRGPGALVEIRDGTAPECHVPDLFPSVRRRREAVANTSSIVLYCHDNYNPHFPSKAVM